MVLEGDDILTVQHALAQRLKQVRAELSILEITRKRKLFKFERDMLPGQLYQLTEAELEEQINPWRTLEEAIHYILEDMELGGPVQEIKVDAKGMEILASMGQRLLTNARPLAEYIDMWPQAAAELRGFVMALRRKAGITALQVQMACELAEMRYQQLLVEARGGDTVETLLRAARTYIEHFVPVEDAKVDGFDVDAWCKAVDQLLPPETPSGPSQQENEDLKDVPYG